MNKVILSGRIVNNPEIRYTPNGKAVVQNALAVRRNFKNEGGDYDADFINVVFWGNQAEYIANYVPKGSLIEVSGRWQRRQYQDNLGNNKYIDECIVEDCSLLSRPQEQSINNQYQQNYSPQKQSRNNQAQTQKTGNYNPFLDEINDEDLPF